MENRCQDWPTPTPAYQSPSPKLSPALWLLHGRIHHMWLSMALGAEKSWLIEELGEGGGPGPYPHAGLPWGSMRELPRSSLSQRARGLPEAAPIPGVLTPQLCKVSRNALPCTSITFLLRLRSGFSLRCSPGRMSPTFLRCPCPSS